jgi:hypothetical protein
MGAKRARFSILLWPSLYPKFTLILPPIVAMLCALLLVTLMRLTEQSDQVKLARMRERANAMIALKLSGAEPWQWKRQFDCQGMSDCLRAEMKFGDSADPKSMQIPFKTDAACKICHDPAKGIYKDKFQITFRGVSPIPNHSELTDMIFVGFALLGFAASATIWYLIRRRKIRGLCIVAMTTTTEVATLGANFPALRQRDAYFAEYGLTRARWATSPEIFSRWLKKNSAYLKANVGQIHFVALHSTYNYSIGLPIELMRNSYQILARVKANESLVDETLIAQMREIPISVRRLVFKSKSDALMKFNVWEFE